MHWFWNNGWSLGPGGFWGLALGGLLNLAFLVAVVALVVWVARAVWRPEAGDRLEGKGGAGDFRPGAGTEQPSALELLNRRYASGEIDRESYLTMKRDLEIRPDRPDL